MYEVRTEKFNGPLDKLLQLIEEKKLEVTMVNLAAVTGDFIKFVESIGEKVEAVILADFVAVASRLLLIKSKVILPNLDLTVEEETDIRDLEYRLKVYREFSARGGSSSGGKTASQHILAIWNRHQIGYSRPLLQSLGEQSFFYPPKKLKTDDMHRSLANLFTVLKGLFPEEAKIRVAVVTLQEKIQELTERISKAASFSFKGALKNGDKQEVIVLFLAVLHMLANRLASVEQNEEFGDIIISKSNVQA